MVVGTINYTECVLDCQRWSRLREVMRTVSVPVEVMVGAGEKRGVGLARRSARSIYTSSIAYVRLFSLTKRLTFYIPGRIVQLIYNHSRGYSRTTSYPFRGLGSRFTTGHSREVAYELNASLSGDLLSTCGVAFFTEVGTLNPFQPTG